MEISTSLAQLNVGLTRLSADQEPTEEEVNAFGIGAANRPQVELSPQARILNEINRVNSVRQDALDEQLTAQNNTEEGGENTDPFNTDSFVTAEEERNAAATNSQNQRAIGLYQSIGNLSE